jgi:hypothetical protein
MLWAKPVVQEFAEHLARVGLKTCPVYSSGTIGVSPAPIVLPYRGFSWVKPGDSGYDAKANILYMFMVVCEFCSHVMLFDSERFTPGDVPSLQPE